MRSAFFAEIEIEICKAALMENCVLYFHFCTTLINVAGYETSRILPDFQIRFSSLLLGFPMLNEMVKGVKGGLW